MKDKNNITAGIDVKLKKSASLYHWIRVFINTRQGETEPKDTFKLRFDNIYEPMELAGRDNILHRKQLTNNGSQESTKKKKDQIY